MPVYFKCREVGLDCPFEVKAKNKKELREKVDEHVKKEHNNETIPPDLKDKIEDAFKKYPAY